PSKNQVDPEHSHQSIDEPTSQNVAMGTHRHSSYSAMSRYPGRLFARFVVRTTTDIDFSCAGSQSVCKKSHLKWVVEAVPSWCDRFSRSGMKALRQFLEQ